MTEPDAIEPAAPPPAPVPPRCANCGAAAPDRFCGRCGQEREKSLRVPAHRLAAEAIAETFTLDSKLGRTLPPLLLRPGAVTRAFLDGKRARFTSPVKLYLLVSFLFFVVAALRPEGGAGLQITVGGEGERQRRALTEEDLAELRAGGRTSRFLADLFEPHAGEPPEVLERRLMERVPQAMFVLVPVLALLLRLSMPRTRVYFAEHLVFALHVHAVAFLLLLPAAASGSGPVMLAGVAAAWLHTAVAMRRVYEKRWAGTVARAIAVGWLYVVALGVTIGLAALWSLWSA